MVSINGSAPRAEIMRDEALSEPKRRSLIQRAQNAKQTSTVQTLLLHFSPSPTIVFSAGPFLRPFQPATCP